METIFKSEHGEVWKNKRGDYGTYTAGHMLCIDLAKEIERLRVELDRRKRWANEFSQRARKAEEEVERLRAELQQRKDVNASLKQDVL